MEHAFRCTYMVFRRVVKYKNEEDKGMKTSREKVELFWSTMKGTL